MNIDEVDEIDLDEEDAPLQKMSCKKTNCTKNLHCFQHKKQNSLPVPGGCCYACKLELVDWGRVRQRNINDIPFLITQLKLEHVRHDYWERPLTEQEKNYAKRKGRAGMRAVLEKRIRKSVGPAHPPRDGFQTPWDGSIVYFAQHATACCCRTCIAEWHNIPAGVALTEEQIQYFVELLCSYVNLRMPELTENGEYVPRIRKKKPPLKG